MWCCPLLNAGAGGCKQSFRTHTKCGVGKPLSLLLKADRTLLLLGQRLTTLTSAAACQPHSPSFQLWMLLHFAHPYPTQS
jgi:hypothetical protein